MGDQVTEEPDPKLCRIVYGEYWRQGGFILFDNAKAVGLSDELAQIRACTTVGETRRLIGTLAYTYIPGNDFEDKDSDPLPDDAQYDCDGTPEAQDGEWPPMPGAYGVDDLPLSLLQELAANAGGRLVHTFSGSSFVVPATPEDKMTDVLRAAGYQVRRDDDLINSLGTQP